jgi:nicotinamidase/pyrazinamidase
MAPSDISLRNGDALLLVDVQNDFLPGGALGVPHGDEVIPVLNAAIDLFLSHGLPVVATRDWHPVNHCSFRERGGPWPPHCIANTPGAAFAAALRLPPEAIVISKAAAPDIDAYSGFQCTELEAVLRARSVRRLIIGGLATDYCVLNTVKDAVDHGYRVYVLQDAIRAVNVHPDDGTKAERAMMVKGAELITTETIR